VGFGGLYVVRYLKTSKQRAVVRALAWVRASKRHPSAGQLPGLEMQLLKCPEKSSDAQRVDSPGVSRTDDNSQFLADELVTRVCYERQQN